MQSIVLRVGRPKPSVPPTRHLANAAAHSRLPKAVHKTLRYTLDVLRARSKSLVWRAVTDLRPNASPAKRIALLRQCEIPLAEYLRWEPVVKAHNLDLATLHFDVKAIKQAEEADVVYSSSSLPLPSTAHPPTWLVLHTICRKVRSPAQAHMAYHIAIGHLPYAQPEMRPPLLILAAAILAAHNVWQPMERVIAIFNGLPIYDESWHFNLLLQGLSHFAASSESARFLGRLALLLLDTMSSRQLTLSPHTYRILLDNRYITSELMEALLQRMLREGHPPQRKDLEAFVRVLEKRRVLDDVPAHSHTIRRLDERKQTPPHISSSSDSDITSSPAAQYLQKLLNMSQQGRRIDAEDDDYNHRHRSTSGNSIKLNHVSTAGEWSARLVHWSRDRSMSSERLYKVFQWLKTRHVPFRVGTTMSYTILMRGLLLKKDYRRAKVVWDEFRASRLRLDRQAVAAGLHVLTKAAGPEEAFAFLEQTYWTARKAKQGATHDADARKVVSRDGAIDTSIINAFMDALNHVGRPDMVFKLWESMDLLWSAKPDAATLAMVLNAARLAGIMFPTFRGALQELGLRNPFRRSPEQPEQEAASLQDARKRALEDLKQLSEPDTKVSEMWGTKAAWRRARDLFRHVVLSRHPALATIETPARAVRSSAEDVAASPFLDFRRSFAHSKLRPALAKEPALHTTPPEILLQHGLHPQGAYPHVLLTDRVFCAYILLLGAQHLAAEIPGALAWMRALGVEPRRRTLAVALVYWAEVSTHAPLLELWGGGEDEYAKLVAWVRDWVGVGRVPTEREVGEAVRMVNEMRRRRAGAM